MFSWTKSATGSPLEKFFRRPWLYVAVHWRVYLKRLQCTSN